LHPKPTGNPDAIRQNRGMANDSIPLSDVSAAADRREEVGADLLTFADGQRFTTLLADPPWQFINRTGKMAPEHRRLRRYSTLSTDDIAALPIASVADERAHLYLWVPNALLPDGLRVLQAWGFAYKTNIVWEKVRKDGGPDGRGVGFYFRNVTELLLFGVRGKNMRTLAPGRRQVNFLATRKREHSRKPDEQYDLIEACSAGPYLELFARGERDNWASWGDQASAAFQGVPREPEDDADASAPEQGHLGLLQADE
jgi:N6-adenosine-specific RNA methylase IME4